MKYSRLYFLIAFLSTYLYASGAPIKINNIYYELDSATGTASVAEGNSGNLPVATIPATVEYNSRTYTVTSIAEKAFYNDGRLRSVSFPETIKKIGAYAFDGCKLITEVRLPSSLEHIDIAAFRSTPLVRVYILGSSLKTIGSAAFNDCDKIKNVIINDLSAWCKINFADGYSNPLSKYSGSTSPAAVLSVIVNGISSPITNLVIPSDVKVIKANAFYGASFASVTIPESVTEIGEYAFFACKQLENVNIRGGVTSIKTAAFSDCVALKSVTLPSSIRNIEKEAFAYCKSLQSINIPEGVTSINRSTFEECTALTSVTIPTSLTSIDHYAFQNCESLASITIPGSVNSLGISAFRGCKSLKSVILPEGIRQIAFGLFAGCSGLASVSIPNSVTSIESSTFEGCTSLTYITIPNTVKYIHQHAFKDCTSIGTLILPEDAYVDKYFAQGAIIKVLDVPYSVSSKWTGEKVYYDLTIQNLIYRSGYLAEIVGAFYKYPKVEESLFVLDSHYEEFKSIDKYFSYDVRKISEFGRNEIGSVVTSIVGGKLHFESDVPFDNVSYKFQTKDACISEGTATAKDIDVPVDFTLYVTAEATKEGKLTALGTTTLPISHSLTPSADVNGDGKVSISDVTKVVNQILCK